MPGPGWRRRSWSAAARATPGDGEASSAWIVGCMAWGWSGASPHRRQRGDDLGGAGMRRAVGLPKSQGRRFIIASAKHADVGVTCSAHSRRISSA